MDQGFANGVIAKDVTKILLIIVCVGIIGIFIGCLFGCASNINFESMEECERYTLHGEFEACQ